MISLDFKLVSQLVDSEGRRVGSTDSISFMKVKGFVNFTRINVDTFCTLKHLSYQIALCLILWIKIYRI